MPVGMVWYRPEDYPHILIIMEDADQLPKTYQRWLKSAEKAEKGIRARGILTLRMFLDAEDFLAYCAREGVRPIAENRSRYAAGQVAALTKSIESVSAESGPFARYINPPT